jgi:arginine exporter protein ArgO
VFGLILVTLGIYYLVWYGQHHLNRLWRHLLEGSEKAAAGMRG